MEYVNIGEEANDGTGDTIRAAFEKVNTNFEDIDEALGDIETVLTEILS